MISLFFLFLSLATETLTPFNRNFLSCTASFQVCSVVRKNGGGLGFGYASRMSRQCNVYLNESLEFCFCVFLLQDKFKKLLDIQDKLGESFHVVTASRVSPLPL